jgi:hypothetical protein
MGEKILKASLLLFTVLSLVLHIIYNFTMTLDVMNSLLSVVYTKPWIRISPYLLGTMTAIYLQRNRNNIEISQVIMNVFVVD